MKRPLIPQADGTVLVPLGGEKGSGRFAVIDGADAELVGRHNWYVWNIRSHRTFYAVTNVRQPDGKYRLLGLHRLVVQGVEEVDHIDGDGLNCRRANLRPATHKTNMRNQQLHRDSTTGFKGVSLDKRSGRYRCCIVVDYRQRSLGYFDTPEAAAQRYDIEAERLYGEFACLNFPKFRAS